MIPFIFGPIVVDLVATVVISTVAAKFASDAYDSFKQPSTNPPRESGDTKQAAQ